MAHLTFPLGCNLIVDIVDILPHLRDLFVRNGKAELLLRLRQRHPQLAPRAEFAVVRKQVLHLFACVPGAQRAQVTVSHFSSVLQ